MIAWLDNESNSFPAIHTALKEPNGLLAAGGDLSPARLKEAYRQGIFPWYNQGEPILWWSPDPRCVLFPEQLHISRSLRKRIRKQDYDVSFDTDFEAVVDACAEPRANGDGTWITRAMKGAYCDLHRQGIAHSVELRINGRLVGGLYGLAMGKMFFGESMFSRETDASKIAFVLMVEQLQNWGYALIDCQVSNNHLKSLGAKEIPRAEFKRYLNKYLDQTSGHDWVFNPERLSFGETPR
ncbi:leucyl/phenylalanyl-tRNA--protein transferase [Pontibacterium sp.]|jgi:leucyl/phenylalanyl-tRNA--protein transferase|uniref:leucyl/phenylalanyl-tRNA--protein transferase n=1 Tax=Pontibacterium sp. TaxID=2036026 RepID=UPI003566253E